MKRQNALAIAVIGIVLAFYIGAYLKVRSSSYWYGGDYYFGISYEELANGSDPLEDPVRLGQLRRLSRVFWPCIQVDQILTGDSILTHGSY